jgi:predicted ATP-dependent endonuclease of OLD family
MLTCVLRAKDDSLLVIDEPDIYLHSDLQRQLLNILHDLGPDILIATHSTEIIVEAERGDIIVVNKKSR